jgi:outer membrane protein
MHPRWAYLIIGGLGLLPLAAGAETLADAIALAYQSNPTLQGARAQLRALDETYVQAHAGYRPTAELQVEPAYTNIQQTNPLTGQPITTQIGAFGQTTLAVNQPIYSGGKTTNAVRAASQDIAQGRAALRGIEAQVLQAVMQAYEDVRRDETILSVHEAEIAALQGHLDDTRARLKVGEVTRTDVEQSEAGLEAARGTLSLARGQLQISRSAYVAVVGQNPGALAPEPPLPGLPTTVDEAFQLAESHNPTLQRAEIAEQASAFRIAEAKAAYRPTVALSATYGYSGALTPFVPNRFNNEVNVGLFVIQPLLTGGMTASTVRQAIETNNSDRINVEAQRRVVIQAVSQAWNQVLAERASAASDARALESARAYFADTLEEYKVGQRSTLDVIIGEQTLTNAQIVLAQARHDTYLAETALLGAVGRLEAENLIAGQPLYDPAAAFRKVSHAGALPWEAVVGEIDALGAPGPGSNKPISAPRLPAKPRSIEGAPIADDAAPATRDPTAPLPRTTSPDTPARLDSTQVLPDAPL